MEALRDLTWIRHISLFSKERFDLRGYHFVLVSVPATETHHADRFRFRLVAIDPALGKAVLSIGLENDILGDYCYSVQVASEQHILGRFDCLPSIEEFRTMALAEAEKRLPGSMLPGEGIVRSESDLSETRQSMQRGRRSRPH